MSPPPDGQTARALAEHVDQGFIWSTIGWIIGGLASVVAVLLGYDRKREAGKVSSLFRWKDDVADPFIADVPKVYVSKHDLEMYVHTPNRQDHEELKGMIREQGKAIRELHTLLIKRAEE